MSKLDWTPIESQPPVPIVPEVRLVKIADIKVTKRLRPVDEAKVNELMESISESGLINPITLTPDLELIAGLHRLEATKRKGWVEIPCNILKPADSAHRQLLEIDENLIRNDPHYTERGTLFELRKKAYEDLYPETKSVNITGGPGRGHKKTNPESGTVLGSSTEQPKRPSFLKDTEEKTGISKSVVAEEMMISQKVIPEAKQVLKAQDRPKQDAKDLAKEPPRTQKKITDLMEERPKSSVKHIAKEVKRDEKREEILNNPPNKTDPNKPTPDCLMLWGDAFKALANPGRFPRDSIRGIPLIATSTVYGTGKDETGDGYVDWAPETWEENFKHFIKLSKQTLAPAGLLVCILGVQIRRMKNGVTEHLPLDSLAIKICEAEGLGIIRQIAWYFYGGVPGGKNSLNGRHESICIFAKGPGYTFNVEDIRVPAKLDDPRNPADGLVNPGDAWYFERVNNEVKQKKGIIHPCTFPPELIERIIKLCSNPGDLVVDPFVGSGTTMAEAIKLGRKAIGIEINKNYEADVRKTLGDSPYVQEDVVPPPPN